MREPKETQEASAEVARPTVRTEGLAGLIRVFRGQQVMLDSDLAELYGVETRVLVQAVKRQARRFPSDFVFRLSQEEFDGLRSQSVMSKGRGGRRSLPYVFTEQGVAMLSSVLTSDRAVEVNIAIMRAFVRMRGLLASDRELRAKLAALEAVVDRHDESIQLLFDAIKALMAPSAANERRRIGFQVQEEAAHYRVRRGGGQA